MSLRWHTDVLSYLIFPLKTCQQSQAPAVDWLGCLQAAFHPHPITEDELVLLHNLPYIVQMSRIIGNWIHKHELRTRYCKWQTKQPTIIHFDLSFFELILPYLIPLSSPLHTFMVLHLLHTLMPALDSRFSGTAKNLSLALGSGEAVSPHRQAGPLIFGKYGVLIFLGIISTR